ncbi:hypothetical protein [Nostoc sp. 'Peltigera membranacea cyanobiont' 232]|uniref:hypothetical protein n=1 Tax=Nostoc sp. 'Peltigera membranacea cyanobiont' 232 TaxID=2014531 RepID=UPI0016786AA3|nr:hypothetical protein [Nostoc sp. 'Peltigera membranacea cyanobiont' 232]
MEVSDEQVLGAASCEFGDAVTSGGTVIKSRRGFITPTVKSKYQTTGQKASPSP